MEVVCSGYDVSFHHCPLVMQEPIEFPSSSLRFVKACTLLEEVVKILGKGPLEEAENP